MFRIHFIHGYIFPGAFMTFAPILHSNVKHNKEIKIIKINGLTVHDYWNKSCTSHFELRFIVFGRAISHWYLIQKSTIFWQRCRLRNGQISNLMLDKVTKFGFLLVLLHLLHLQSFIRPKWPCLPSFAVNSDFFLEEG